MFTNIFNIAKANIKGGKKYPKINGAVTFREVKNGVLVTAKVNGLPHLTVVPVDFLDFIFMKAVLVVEL